MILEVKDLSVFYGAIQALHGISFEVEEKEIVSLIGVNGAGKSTTLRAVSGLVRPRSGRVIYQDRDLSRVRAHGIVRLDISQCPEGRRIFTNLTVLENLEMGAYTRPNRTEIAESLERVFHHFPRLKERPKHLVAEIFAIIKDINAEGTTVLLVEQNAAMALAIANRAYVLETGRVLAQGEAAELRVDPRIRAAYLGDVMLSG